MDNTQFGIKEEELKALSLEILSKSDKLSEIFEKISNRMSDLETHYHGEPSVKIKEYYQSIKNSYEIVRKNLNTYSEDLAFLIEKAKANDKELGNQLTESIELLNQENRKDFSLRNK